jgi:hypothetical protein
VEARLWVGKLTESEYFDNDPSNDYTMFHGLSAAYAPSFLPGLVFSINRVCLVPWEWENLKYIIINSDNTIEDQKLSFDLSWTFPQVGFEIFGELGIDDYVPGGTAGYIRHPFHTTVYTAGLKKIINISPEKNIFGEIVFESNWMEMTQDFQFEWHYSFYFHNLITQGYTNKGQWLGNGNSFGGNSQYLAYKIYYPQGSTTLFVSRNNPDNNYLYKEAIYDSAENKELGRKNANANKANFLLGLSSGLFFKKIFFISGGLVYDLIINPLYGPSNNGHDISYWHNFSVQLGLKLIL